MNQVTEHISFDEATISQTATRKGIINIPNNQQLENMKLVAEKCFEPVREHFGVPLKVSSFFRCEKLNKAVGGASNSQHVKGQAIDIQATSNITNAQIFEYIKKNLEFDQLIWEYGTNDNPAWVHVSFSNTHNRKQVIRVK